MSEDAASLLVQGIAWAKEGDKRQARDYLERALLWDPDYDQRAKALLWLAKVSDDPQEKRNFLEGALAINLTNPEARQELAILEGRLTPKEIIDPFRPPGPADAAPGPEVAQGQSLVCPNCGSSLSAPPGQTTLACPRCGYQQALSTVGGRISSPQPQDFIATALTARGHQWELPHERVLTCGGCGATFTLPPRRISGACPFCGSNQTAVASKRTQLIQPGGVAAFQFDVLRALAHTRQWLREQRFRPGDLDTKATFRRPSPMYIPCWCFTVGGAVDWQGMMPQSAGDDTVLVPSAGDYPVSAEDVLVSGSRTLPEQLMAALLVSYDLRALAPYTPDLLAGWPTEVYQVALVEASLTAHQHAFERTKNEASKSTLLAGMRDLQFTSANVTVLSFNLLLLPVWSTDYTYQNQHYPVLVNGQTGAAQGEVPRSGWQKALGGLFGER
ncbi:MAG: hypothetical protein HYY02_00655 [Chloroflexi bacterium]|nr:hypothetical protein [Chloroflexota bacterium]